MDNLILIGLILLGGIGFILAKKFGNPVLVLAANSFLDYVVEMVVSDLEQTVKKEMKKQDRWDDQGKKDIKDQAVDMVLRMLDGKIGLVVESVYGSLKEMVSARIESQVLKNKR